MLYVIYVWARRSATLCQPLWRSSWPLSSNSVKPSMTRWSLALPTYYSERFWVVYYSPGYHDVIVLLRQAERNELSYIYTGFQLSSRGCNLRIDWVQILCDLFLCDIVIIIAASHQAAAVLYSVLSVCLYAFVSNVSQNLIYGPLQNW